MTSVELAVRFFASTWRVYSSVMKAFSSSSDDAPVRTPPPTAPRVVLPRRDEALVPEDCVELRRPAAADKAKASLNVCRSSWRRGLSRID